MGYIDKKFYKAGKESGYDTRTILAVFTVINILLTRKLSIRTNDLNKKTGIDLSIHKDLMNNISDFLNSITEISLFLEYSWTAKNLRKRCAR